MQHATGLILDTLARLLEEYKEFLPALKVNKIFPVQWHPHDIMHKKYAYYHDTVEQELKTLGRIQRKMLTDCGFSSIDEADVAAGIGLTQYPWEIVRYGLLAQHIAKHGVYEISVTPEQAVGLSNMKFNLDVADFQMPRENVMVHIPRQIWNHPMFQNYAEEVIQDDATKPEKDTLYPYNKEIVIETHEHLVKWYTKVKEGKVDITVVVSRHLDDPTPCIRLNMLANSELKHAVSLESIIIPISGNMEEQLKPDTDEKFILACLERIALGTILVSVMKESVIKRDVDASVMRERKRTIEKFGRVIPIKHEEFSYHIFQPNMKTYNKHGDGDGEPTGITRESITLRPQLVTGFFRMQGYGKGWSEKKLIWIKSFIRNKRLLRTNDPAIVMNAALTHTQDVIEAVVETSKEI